MQFQPKIIILLSHEFNTALSSIKQYMHNIARCRVKTKSHCILLACFCAHVFKANGTKWTAIRIINKFYHCTNTHEYRCNNNNETATSGLYFSELGTKIFLLNLSQISEFDYFSFRHCRIPKIHCLALIRWRLYDTRDWIYFYWEKKGHSIDGSDRIEKCKL